MDRVKQFGRYALMIIVFYIISDVLIYFGLIGMYKNFSGEIVTETPIVEVLEAKATKQSGFIKGKVKNDTESKIEEKYIKIDLFSERDTYLGSKYLKIQNLDVNQEISFETQFEFSNIYRYELSVVEKEREYTEEELVSDEIRDLFLTGILLRMIM